ncbi:protein SLOW GREEN 1, chloroplastic-like [Lycium ferocissimum]|uniref:protein SLOW GREEN 1, chloroplastic-like n=1 Tax=Lycium ferocissimum TaxID=112874 RepID=UPI00281550DA|nr:protein SLOW GREEN 1, chloroplastic-like [Lycium ferocissimum]
MTTLNPVCSKPNQIQKQFYNLNHRPIYAKPISCLSFKTPFSPSFFSIKASQNPKISKPINPNEKPQNNPFFSSFLKPTLIATITATTLLFARFIFYPKPAFSSPKVMQTDVKETVSNEEKEREIQEHLISNPDDVEALRSLMEIYIKNKKMLEAIGVIDRLIEIEPNEPEWPLLKSHLYVNFGEVELAKVGFNEILKKDPLRVEAYHGLVMAASQDESIEEIKEIEKKVEEGMKLCKKENKKSDLRDFKLLLAQIRVIEGKYEDALKVYQELVKEEPRDFRPYLCQGIIYTLLRKSNEAEKCFEKYRRLVPQGHPYARYFDENMIATKVFAQKVENERAGSKS